MAIVNIHLIIIFKIDFFSVKNKKHMRNYCGKMKCLLTIAIVNHNESPEIFTLTHLLFTLLAKTKKKKQKWFHLCLHE